MVIADSIARDFNIFTRIKSMSIVNDVMPTNAERTEYRYKMINLDVDNGNYLPIIVRRDRQLDEPFHDDEQIATGIALMDMLENDKLTNQMRSGAIGAVAATLIPLAINALPHIISGVKSVIGKIRGRGGEISINSIAKRFDKIPMTGTVHIPNHIRQFLTGKSSGRLYLSNGIGSGMIARDRNGDDIESFGFDPDY